MKAEFITTKIQLDRRLEQNDENKVPLIRQEGLTIIISLIGYGDTFKISDEDIFREIHKLKIIKII